MCRFFVLALFLASCADGCSGESVGWQCKPLCGGQCGVDDGCGGLCGCADGFQCGAANQCEAANNAACPAGQILQGDACVDAACASWQGCKVDSCGMVCGESCGACALGQSCEEGTCTAGCDDFVCTHYNCGSICGQDCGGCGAGQSCVDNYCSYGTSTCTDCPLQLVLVSKDVAGGKVTGATFDIVHQPNADHPPRMMDLRLRASAPFTVTSVTLPPGNATAAAQKSLYDYAAGDGGQLLEVGQVSSQVWSAKPDGSVQILVLSLTNTDPIGAGVIARLQVQANIYKPGVTDVRFNLSRRAEVLAPPRPDLILQNTNYDFPLLLKAN
jgi:hypothetical protein